MDLIRTLSVGILLTGLVLQGCSREDAAPAQELVAVEPARAIFGDDFVVRVAMQGREGLGVSIFKAGAGESAAPLTAQPLEGSDALLTAEFGTVRLNPGQYFAAVTDKAGNRIAGAEFSVISPDARPRIRIRPSSLYPGDPISVTLRGMPPGDSGWLGIYAKGEANLAAYLARQDTDGAEDADRSEGNPLIFEAADFGKALAPGKYEIRLMRAGGYVELANAPFVVSNPDAKPELMLGSPRIKTGDPIVVSFKDAPGTDGDQVAIYKADESDRGKRLVYLRTGGGIVGQVVFTKEKYRQKLPPGQYVLKLSTDQGAKELASTRFWMIDADGAPKIATAKSRVRPGDPIEVFWTSAPAQGHAWIGVFKADDPDPSHVLARHAEAAVDGGVTFKAADFAAELQPGEYRIRLMRADGTGEFAGVQLTVLDPGAAPQVAVATPVKSGQPVKVSWRGSPGNQRDWIGLYKASEANTHNYIKWLYTDGAVDGEVSFPDALPPGEYVARLLIDNGYEEFASSAPFSVTAE